MDKNSFTITTHCDSKTSFSDSGKRPKWEKLLDMASVGINNEEEKYYGLAQSYILDGFLYRTLRRNWLFNTGGYIVT